MLEINLPLNLLLGVSGNVCETTKTSARGRLSGHVGYLSFLA